MPETSTAPALGADTAEADEASSERCAAQATKLPVTEFQSENKRNVTRRGTKT